MTYRYNSHIKIKVEPCTRCGHPKPVFKRNKKEGTVLCKECATITSTQAAIEEEESKLIVSDLGPLIIRADEIYSKWLRLSYANEFRMLNCYTCETYIYWTAADCGHFKKRGNMLLRWDPRNTRPQCEQCNRKKGGMEVEFARRLNLEFPGIVDILEEEANLVYKADRTEINGYILDYTQKFKALRHATN